MVGGENEKVVAVFQSCLEIVKDRADVRIRSREPYIIVPVTIKIRV